MDQLNAEKQVLQMQVNSFDQKMAILAQENAGLQTQIQKSSQLLLEQEKWIELTKHKNEVLTKENSGLSKRPTMEAFEEISNENQKLKDLSIENSEFMGVFKKRMQEKYDLLLMDYQCVQDKLLEVKNLIESKKKHENTPEDILKVLTRQDL